MESLQESCDICSGTGIIESYWSCPVLLRKEARSKTCTACDGTGLFELPQKPEIPPKDQHEPYHYG